MGDRRLHPRAAAQRTRHDGRCARREAHGTGESTMTPQLSADFDRIRQRAVIIGGVGVALLALGWLTNPDQFYRSYLVGFLFWNGLALGCLAIACLHQLSGGAWGAVIRRILESAMRTFPVMLVLFLPLLFGIHNLYVWSNPAAV